MVLLPTGEAGEDHVIMLLKTFYSLLGSGASVALHSGPGFELQETLVS